MPNSVPDRGNHPARKMAGSDRALYLQGTSMHGKPNTRAVIWTKPNEGQEKGVRYEGNRVTPTKEGVLLHGGLKPQHFSDHAIDEVHYYQPKAD